MSCWEISTSNQTFLDKNKKKILDGLKRFVHCSYLLIWLFVFCISRFHSHTNGPKDQKISPKAASRPPLNTKTELIRTLIPSLEAGGLLYTLLRECGRTLMHCNYPHSWIDSSRFVIGGEFETIKKKSTKSNCFSWNQCVSLSRYSMFWENYWKLNNNCTEAGFSYLHTYFLLFSTDFHGDLFW